MPTTWSMFSRPTPLRVAVRRHRHVARLERARVVLAVDERVDRVAVRRDRRRLDRAELVLLAHRLDDAARAALHGLAVRLGRVGNGERDVLHAVAVARVVLRDVALLADGGRHDEPDVALLEHVRGAVAHARLRPCVRGAREAERVLVEVGRLLRVADPELDVVPAAERHEVFGHAGDYAPGGGGRIFTGSERTPYTPCVPFGPRDQAPLLPDRRRRGRRHTCRSRGDTRRPGLHPAADRSDGAPARLRARTARDRLALRALDSRRERCASSSRTRRAGRSRSSLRSSTARAAPAWRRASSSTASRCGGRTRRTSSRPGAASTA